MKTDFELTSDDFSEDRYSRLRLIPWWDQEILKKALIMVIGAGAIGNELIKNLSLLGIGRILIVDMDRIEHTNLTRSVLFRVSDVGRYKADAAAEKAMEINPDVRAKALNCNIVSDLGLGVFRRAQVVLGGLDNREARLAINQHCYRVNRPWIDGAIEVLNGFARVFIPYEGACYECTMTEMDWRLLNKRKSCAMLSHEQMAEGKIPTTPTSSSIIAGTQVQELLKILHKDRELPTLAGKGFVFNGLTNDSFIVEYQRKPDCLCHDPGIEVEERPWSVRKLSLNSLLDLVKEEMGSEAQIDFDREFVSKATCTCGHEANLNRAVHGLTFKMLTCPECGKIMGYDSFHSIKGDEKFLDTNLFDLGVPLLHIVTGRNGSTVKNYEFSADFSEIFSGLE